MSRKSYYYSKKLNAISVQQIFALPRLRSVSVINVGKDNIQVEFENDIDNDSIIIPAGMSHTIATDMLDIRYKALSSIATIYLSGLKHVKS